MEMYCCHIHDKMSFANTWFHQIGMYCYMQWRYSFRHAAKTWMWPLLTDAVRKGWTLMWRFHKIMYRSCSIDKSWLSKKHKKEKDMTGVHNRDIWYDSSEELITDGLWAGDFKDCIKCVEWQTEDTHRDIICTWAAVKSFKRSDRRWHCSVTSNVQTLFNILQ